MTSEGASRGPRKKFSRLAIARHIFRPPHKFCYNSTTDHIVATPFDIWPNYNLNSLTTKWYCMHTFVFSSVFDNNNKITIIDQQACVYTWSTHWQHCLEVAKARARSVGRDVSKVLNVNELVCRITDQRNEHLQFNSHNLFMARKHAHASIKRDATEQATLMKGSAFTIIQPKFIGAH